MPSSHLILCRPLLLLPPIPPSIRVFSDASTLRMRWPKYWSFSFSIISSKEHPGLISFGIDWLDLLQSSGLWGVFSNTTVQKLCSLCSQFFSAQLSSQSNSHIHTWLLEKPLLSHVQIFVTPWTIQSMDSSRPEYWCGSPFPSPGDLPNTGIEPRSPASQADSLPAEPPHGKPKNTEVGSLSLFQQIFLTQESNQGLLHYRRFFTNWALREAPEK